jgi:asparagine synthetase B (glutamine-hydrolysing)
MRGTFISNIADVHFLSDRRELYKDTDFEDYEYKIYYRGKGWIKKNMREDAGALGLAQVADFAQRNGYRVYLSGSGADETISDYAISGKPIFSHSNFSGIFPSDLKEIFPWPSFYGSTQRSYLGKEECIAGNYGLDTRYPFLDVDVVQAYLNLKSNLKNMKYKAPIFNYLVKEKMPTQFDMKFGF